MRTDRRTNRSGAPDTAPTGASSRHSRVPISPLIDVDDDDVDDDALVDDDAALLLALLLVYRSGTQHRMGTAQRYANARVDDNIMVNDGWIDE